MLRIERVNDPATIAQHFMLNSTITFLINLQLSVDLLGNFLLCLIAESSSRAAKLSWAIYANMEPANKKKLDI